MRDQNSIKNPNYKHGLHHHPLYRVWTGMKDRCYRQKNTSYKNYGGRGICMCDEWKNNSKIFLDWAINNGWQPDLEIDRINVNGNYEPNNCKFVTLRENTSNKRNKSAYGTGVRKTQSGKFQSYIVLGTFDTQEMAQEVYRLALIALKNIKT